MNSEYQSLPPATQQAVMSAAEAIVPEQSVDEVRQRLSVTDKGKTANTIDNCRIVFCCDPLLRDAVRLNLLTDRVDIVQDLGWRRNTSALTDTDVKYLLLYFEKKMCIRDSNYIDKDDFLREMYLNTVGNNERGTERYERMRCV